MDPDAPSAPRGAPARKIAVLGASPNRDRHSNFLIRRLLEKGDEVFPVNPAHATIEGSKVYPRLEALPSGIEVLSIYMSPAHSQALAESILAADIPRVVFNPGAENPDLAQRLRDKGVEVLDACSLVLSGMNEL